MRSLYGLLVLCCAAMWPGGAAADHMTGRYQGTGDISGVFLDLRQSGTALQGDISGADQGVLEGQTDGGNNANGVIRLSGSAPFQFQAIWSQQGLALTLLFGSGNRNVMFVPAGGAGPGPGDQPPPVQTDVQYYVAVGGQPFGPLTFDEMLQRIRQGETGPGDLVWKTGAPDWARADSYPELADAFAPPQPGPPPLPPGGGGPDGPPPPPDGGGSGMTPPSGPPADPGGGGGEGGGGGTDPGGSDPGGGGGAGGGGGGGEGGGGITPPSN